MYLITESKVDGNGINMTVSRRLCKEIFLKKIREGNDYKKFYWLGNPSICSTIQN